MLPDRNVLSPRVDFFIFDRFELSSYYISFRKLFWQISYRKDTLLKGVPSSCGTSRGSNSHRWERHSKNLRTLPLCYWPHYILYVWWRHGVYYIYFHLKKNSVFQSRRKFSVYSWWVSNNPHPRTRMRWNFPKFNA